MSNDVEERVREAVAKLRTERDELRVQMHLAAAEVRDEWEELEEGWDALEARLTAAGHEAADASRDVGAALALVSEEVAIAYRRIRDRLKG